MAIQHLSDEEIRTWTLAQKDEWWYKNVYKGNMPQLTLRAAISGMIIGGLLSLTNLYVGAKTGWTLGVGITSVILAFAAFKVMTSLSRTIPALPEQRGFMYLVIKVLRFILPSREFSVLENNCMQSIATAAGYMTSPLIASLGAYMVVTNSKIPVVTTIIWIVALGALGILFAFPLKRRFINDEQHPFPEGRAAGVVMDALHSGDAAVGMLKAKLLVVTGAFSAAFKFLQSEPILAKLKVEFMSIPEYLDDWIYKITSLKAGGIELRELTVRVDTDLVMVAAGGLMGIRTGISIMVGAFIEYLILAPRIIELGDIKGKVVEDVTHYGFKTITMWGLWCGVAMMTTASLVAFFSKPQIMVSAFRGLLSRGKVQSNGNDVLRNVELPMWVFAIGIPIVGALVVFLGSHFFDIGVILGIIAVPLVFVFTLIAVNSTALTSITPTGALGKLTQLTYGALAPGNVTTNLMTAGITGEVAGNASNLLMDIKPGYMLGGKPRQQAIGHFLGVIAGSLVAVPVFYLIFLRNGPANLVTEQYPMPGVTIWKGVAEALSKGLSQIPESARWAALIGGTLGIGLEVTKILTKGRFWLSGVGIGLAFVIPFNTCLAMFLGSFIFYLAGRRYTDEKSWGNRIIVQNQEPICAGIIAGGALMAILTTVIEIFVVGK